LFIAVYLSFNLFFYFYLRHDKILETTHCTNCFKREERSDSRKQGVFESSTGERISAFKDRDHSPYQGHFFNSMGISSAAFGLESFLLPIILSMGEQQVLHYLPPKSLKFLFQYAGVDQYSVYFNWL